MYHDSLNEKPYSDRELSCNISHPVIIPTRTTPFRIRPHYASWDAKTRTWNKRAKGSCVAITLHPNNSD